MEIFAPRAVKQFKAIIKSEVPAALLLETLKYRMSTGMARNPPPMPNNPDSEPITRDSTTRIQNGICFSALLLAETLNIE
jgi:hypothetical protein